MVNFLFALFLIKISSMDVAFGYEVSSACLLNQRIWVYVCSSAPVFFFLLTCCTLILSWIKDCCDTTFMMKSLVRCERD